MVKDGIFGLIPNETRPGDIVCTFEGSVVVTVGYVPTVKEVVLQIFSRVDESDEVTTRDAVSSEFCTSTSFRLSGRHFRFSANTETLQCYVIAFNTGLNYYTKKTCRLLDQLRLATW